MYALKEMQKQAAHPAGGTLFSNLENMHYRVILELT